MTGFPRIQSQFRSIDLGLNVIDFLKYFLSIFPTGGWPQPTPWVKMWRDSVKSSHNYGIEVGASQVRIWDCDAQLKSNQNQIRIITFSIKCYLAESPSHEQQIMFVNHRTGKSLHQFWAKPGPKAAHIVQQEHLLIIQLCIFLRQGLGLGEWTGLGVKSSWEQIILKMNLLRQYIYHHLPFPNQSWWMSLAFVESLGLTRRLKSCTQSRRALITRVWWISAIKELNTNQYIILRHQSSVARNIHIRHVPIFTCNISLNNALPAYFWLSLLAKLPGTHQSCWSTSTGRAAKDGRAVRVWKVWLLHSWQWRYQD